MGLCYKHTDVKGKLGKYYNQFYDNKFDNLDETDKVLERYKLPKLTVKKEIAWIALLGENSPRLQYFCMSFQRRWYTEQPWKIEIASPLEQ